MMTGLDKSYVPLEDDEEEYMGPIHLEYFRRVLLEQRGEMIKQIKLHMHGAISDLESPSADHEDYAAASFYSEMYLMVGDRCRKAINEIDQALARVESGEYGYCLKTGEEIGIERLKANPTAVFCIEAQEENDRML